nr:MAG TPA: hypothetical protein [Caudoviricetes sp.]
MTANPMRRKRHSKIPISEMVWHWLVTMTTCL